MNLDEMRQKSCKATWTERQDQGKGRTGVVMWGQERGGIEAITPGHRKVA